MLSYSIDIVLTFSILAFSNTMNNSRRTREKQLADNARARARATEAAARATEAAARATETAARAREAAAEARLVAARARLAAARARETAVEARAAPAGRRILAAEARQPSVVRDTEPRPATAGRRMVAGEQRQTAVIGVIGPRGATAGRRMLAAGVRQTAGVAGARRAVSDARRVTTLIEVRGLVGQARQSTPALMLWTGRSPFPTNSEATRRNAFIRRMRMLTGLPIVREDGTIGINNM